MPAYKDKAKGTWYASFYYEDWTGKKVKKMKRGFPTKREALEWERTFLQQQTADLEMTFENFVAVYVADMKGRIKENTWGTKEHKFDMISGTNGLLGAADGAFLLQKEKRTDGSAILDVAGRDQQDQRMYLTKDKERLVWELERLETEPWVEPPDPVLEAVAALVTVDRPAWGGTATELVAALQTDMKPNALAMRLNVRAGRLAAEYHIRYENSRSHAGRSITLTLEPPQA